MKKPFAIIFLLLVLTGCATSPTGRSQLIMVGDEQMAASGQQLFLQMKEQGKVVRDPGASATVSCVVNALLPQLPPAWQGGWEVQVFEDKEPNAFALPGRKIGVNTGMVKLVQNDAQLAAVIGHEIGHVLARHANERASMSVVSQLGAGMAEVMAPGTGDLVNIGSQVGVLLPYSRAHEAEADIIGQNLMANAGFDPRESIQLWKLMEKQGGGKPPELLSTHPANASRIQELAAHLQTTMPMFQRAQNAGRRPHCQR
jgi:predicted Zn-dependent protease